MTTIFLVTAPQVKKSGFVSTSFWLYPPCYCSFPSLPFGLELSTEGYGYCKQSCGEKLDYGNGSADSCNLL